MSFWIELKRNKKEETLNITKYVMTRVLTTDAMEVNRERRRNIQGLDSLSRFEIMNQ